MKTLSPYRVMFLLAACVCLLCACNWFFDSTLIPCGDDEYSAGAERIGVIKSTDGGTTWTALGHACFHAPTLIPVDPFPTIEDGRIVLYFYDIASQQDDAPADAAHVIYRATSSDGLMFTTPTEVYSTTDNTVTDPAVIPLDDGTFRMYLSVGGTVLSALTADGLTYTDESGTRSSSGGVPGVLVLQNGDTRLFVCGSGIVSLISSDGLAFADEAGTRISGSGGDIVCDPHPIRLQDGTYLMTYKVRPSGVQGPRQDEVYLATSTDGLTWQTGGDAIVTGSVPGLVQLEDGTLLVYYVDFSQG